MSVAPPPRHPLLNGGTAKRAAAVLAMVVLSVGGFVLVSRSVNTGGLVAIGLGLLCFPVVGAGFLYLARGRRTEQRLVVATVTVTGLALGAVLFATSRGNEVDEKIVTGAPAPAEASVPASDPSGASSAAAGSTGESPRPGGKRSSKGDRSGARSGAADSKAEPGSARREGPTASSDRPRAVAAAPAPVAESAPAPRPEGNVQTLSGSFSGESGHRGSGKAAVVELPSGERKLTFSKFDVDPGAGGLRVYLTAGRVGSDADVGDFKELGGLKGTRGDQQYDIPRNIDLNKYGTVVIWCVPFTTRIAQAKLR